jgi:integrase
LEFKRFLRSRTDIGIATKNKYLATARIFLKELARSGRIPTDITVNVKSFSQSKKHKRNGINNEEMQKLANHFQQLSQNHQNSRLRAIFSLLALQGLRQCEIVRLDVKDLDLINMTAFIQGKGQDDKEIIHLHPETTKVLHEYMKANKIASGALFTSESNSSRNHRLTTRAIRGIIGEVFHTLSIHKTVHGFRHYFATTLVKNYKGDLLEVAQYTRHKSLEMLQVYNDNVNRQADLPRFYNAFPAIKL